MNIRRLADRAKTIIERRGGTTALKQDAEELRDIAKRRGSMGDKVKEGVEAVKDPGAPGPGHRERSTSRGSTRQPSGR